jgi:L-alanine-DL-glutamate epimerase-like enolase superfamily enzyme
LSWTISCGNIVEAETLLEQGLERGYGNFNIKLGVRPDFDLKLCEMIKQRVPDGFLWGDANGGYTFGEALKMIPSLEDAGLDLLEQPIPSTQMRDWHALKRTMRIPLAVDEPIVSPRDLMEWVRQDLISAFATKVSRNGGLFPSRICAEIAEHTPLMTVCSGLTETGLGLTANLHLACAFGVQTPCAWNGPQFLADDILTIPLRIQDGIVHLPDAPGLGVEVDERKLAFYASKVSSD